MLMLCRVSPPEQALKSQQLTSLETIFYPRLFLPWYVSALPDDLPYPVPGGFPIRFANPDTDMCSLIEGMWTSIHEGMIEGPHVFVHPDMESGKCATLLQIRRDITEAQFLQPFLRGHPVFVPPDQFVEPVQDDPEFLRFVNTPLAAADHS